MSSSVTSKAVPELNPATNLEQCEFSPNHQIAITGFARTPFVKAGTHFKKYDSIDLAAHCVSQLAEKQKINENLNQLVFGSVIPDPKAPDLAIEVLRAADLPANQTQAFTVSSYCITSFVAISMLAQNIASGEAEIGIAGGTESMSNPVLALSSDATRFLYDVFFNKNLTRFQKLAELKNFKPSFLFPEIPSPTEPATGLTMREHCQLTANIENISGVNQDTFAASSHIKARRAQFNGEFNNQIVPFNGIEADTMVRADTSIHKLLKLRARADELPNNFITAGVSTDYTDGAAAVTLMSVKAAKANKQTIYATISEIEFASIDPLIDGLLQGSALATLRLLHKKKISISEIDYFEIHEAFAAQVLTTLRFWEKGFPAYNLAPIGKVPMEKINVLGGSLALGHPFAATGARLCMIAETLYKRRLQTGKPQTALVTSCAAGGKGAALLLKSYQD